VGSKYAWAKAAIDILTAQGIIQGTSDHTFEPEKPIKRADAVLLLVRALDLQGQSGNNFADVAGNKYYADALSIAKKTGIITGTSDNRFLPNQSITRQDLMVNIARALEKSGKLKLSSSTSELSGYRDRANVSEYAAPSVAALLRAGIVNGYNSQILPKQPVTRAEAAVIIYNTLKQYQQ